MFRRSKLAEQHLPIPLMSRFWPPQPENTTKYRSHSELCVPKKLPTGVVMDGIAIPWSDDQNSLSSIPQYHQYRDLGLPQPGSTTKYRSHSGLCMPKKLPTGVVMDGIAIPWSDDQNSLSSILYTAKKAISASRGPGAPPNIARTADFVCRKAPHRCCNGWHCDPMVRRSKLAEQHLLYRQKSDFCLPWPKSTTKYRSHSGLCMQKSSPPVL